MRHSKVRNLLALGSTAALAAACVPAGQPNDGRLGVEIPEIDESSPLALTFEEAGAEYGVPVDVLKALAYVETRFEPAAGTVEFEGRPEPFGLFALRGAELELAAAIIGVSVEEVMTDDVANVRGAAALLDRHAERAGLTEADREDVEAWGPAIERFGDLTDETMRGVLAREVLAVLEDGVAVPLADGTTMVVGRYDGLDVVRSGEFGTSASGLRSPLAVWRPSPNYNSRGGRSPELVIIHTCEGGYSGCVSWLRNSASGVSAHYVVNESGSEISQLVDEVDRAWHVGASYRSWLNSGQLTHLDGISVNTVSIGIEHGGFASQSSWPQGQIDKSVDLVRDITARNNIPRDRYHIVAHGQLQPESRTDPGPNWPWTSYLAAISGTNPPNPSVITVDNATSGRFTASSSWGTSSWASGKYGSDYRYRAAASLSDPASYKVNVTAAGNYEVFARVPGNGYNTNQPFVIHHSGGTTVVHKNISNLGASWVSLGTYHFSQKDDWIVQISCWTNGSGWIIADAIRLESR